MTILAKKDVWMGIVLGVVKCSVWRKWVLSSLGPANASSICSFGAIGLFQYGHCGYICQISWSLPAG
jgi:hypothetical protein